ncbi:MAG: hypothetical protein JKY02_07790 [Flavobacteriaceae bacterium]|nr:hypothetical protein [Flavobacteriaceae bacterium]
MKNSALILVLILLSCTDSSNLQSDPINEPFLMVSESNKWYQNGSLEELDVPNGILKEIRRKLIYYFEGDTLITNVLFKKMYSKQFDSIFHQSISGGLQQYHSIFNSINYVTAMRQESDLVYYVPANQSTEEVYVDFNVSIGEVLNYKWNVNNEAVTEIDSIQIGATYLTKYKLSNDQYFYEGIGASYGLFKGWEVATEVGGFLNCFKFETDKIGIDEGFNAPINFCPEF